MDSLDSQIEQVDDVAPRPTSDSQADSSASQSQVPQTAKKRILFRIFAILIGLSPLICVELFLIATDWHPDGVTDPFIGFTNSRPLFVKNDDGSRYQIAESRIPLFQPESFLVEKPDDEFRIFCIGGSTVQGRPWSIETSFSTWLEIGLNAVDSSKKWNAINCGGVSYASYRLAPIVEEVLQYDPDLIILMTGHNEFLEDRTYASVKSTPQWIRDSHEKLSSIRTYAFLRSKFVSSTEIDKEQLPENAEARLDFKNGLKQYTRDDEWKTNVAIHFEHNLRRMIKTTADSDVPMILMSPVNNLKDIRPFKSEYNSAWSEEETKEFVTKLNKVENLSDDRIKVEKLESLMRSNPRHAELHFALGHFYLQTGQNDLAKQQFILAKEEDICPLRITEPLLKVIKEVRSDSGISLVDLNEYFESQSESGIVGDESLVDHIHPSIHGHQQVAWLLLQEMEGIGYVRMENLDRDTVDAQFASHLATLPFMYFQRGKDRLAGLQRWAAGQVTEERERKRSKDHKPTDSITK